MSQAASCTIADLPPGTVRDRLAEATAGGTVLTIDCAARPRLPVAFLAAVVDGARWGFVRLTGLAPAARIAVQLCDRTGSLAGPPPTVIGESPLLITLDDRGRVQVRPSKGLAQHPFLSDPDAHEWLRGLEASAVEVDLREHEHINSLTVAWLLHLNQACAPVPVSLVRVSRQALTQLTQLRLNHLMAISAI